jgi:hypothetical protein
MPDPPSFIFTLLERVENNQAGDIILQIRKIHYTGGRDGDVYNEELIASPLKGDNIHIVDSRDEWIKRLRLINNSMYKKVLSRSENWVNRLGSSDDIFTRRLNGYFQTVISRFHKWYDEYKLEPPGNDHHPPARTPWTGTKSEFARYIRKEYETHQDEYRSLRDATFKIYDKYHFPFEWTKEKCDGLVRKN